MRTIYPSNTTVISALIFSFTLVLIIPLLLSCETEESLTSRINELKKEKLELENTKLRHQQKVSSYKHEIIKLEERLKELKIYETGKQPQYILKLELKQSRISIDVGNLIKDEMNAVELELPVSKQFYNSVSIGTRILKEFRSGSFILKGSIGDWRIKVIDKKIVSPGEY